MSGRATVTFKWTPQEFVGTARKAVEKGMRDAAMLAVDITIRQLGTNHGGRPSKPGSPPNTQTGRLRRSHYWELTRNPIGFRVGAMAPYAGFLEHGTSRMAPRPWLSIAITRHRARIRDRFVQSATAVMKAGARK